MLSLCVSCLGKLSKIISGKNYVPDIFCQSNDPWTEGKRGLHEFHHHILKKRSGNYQGFQLLIQEKNHKQENFLYECCKVPQRF